VTAEVLRRRQWQHPRPGRCSRRGSCTRDGGGAPPARVANTATGEALRRREWQHPRPGRRSSGASGNTATGALRRCGAAPMTGRSSSAARAVHPRRERRCRARRRAPAPHGHAARRSVPQPRWLLDAAGGGLYPRSWGRRPERAEADPKAGREALLDGIFAVLVDAPPRTGDTPEVVRRNRRERARWCWRATSASMPSSEPAILFFPQRRRGRGPPSGARSSAVAARGTRVSSSPESPKRFMT